METRHTSYGLLRVGTTDALHAWCLERLQRLAAAATGDLIVGLSGGSTPQALFAHIVRHGLPGMVRARAVWTVSDERMVPLDAPDSNFGNAWRLLLQPCGVPAARTLPWPVGGTPEEAAAQLNAAWQARFGADRGFDLCLLGMGDDGHTASLFPGSELLGATTGANFAGTEVPGRGPRLTITPAGLARCREVIVLVTGAAKAAMLRAVLTSPFGSFPAQLAGCDPHRTTWLVDRVD
jgi:6-phosphogluconolactonase